MRVWSVTSFTLVQQLKYESSTFVKIHISSSKVLLFVIIQQFRSSGTMQHKSDIMYNKLWKCYKTSKATSVVNCHQSNNQQMVLLWISEDSAIHLTRGSAIAEEPRDALRQLKYYGRFLTELLTRSSANPQEPCKHTVSWNRVNCCTNVRRIACKTSATGEWPSG